MGGSTARMNWMEAVRLVARMASICSSDNSSAAPKTPYPALLIATSIRPKSATVRSMTARSAAVSRTSSTSARNLSGCALARPSTVVGLRTVPTTRSPRANSCSVR
jgi:hypothetical protein